MARITTGANASLSDNIQLQKGAVVLRRLVHLVVGATSNSYLGEYVQTVRLDGTLAVTVNAISAEAASVVYAASLWARRVAD